jgi:hypothetical protein
MKVDWQFESAKINRHVDRIIKYTVEGGALPVTVVAIDQVYRPYLQWLHAAQESAVDPTLVRNSTINLITTMIIEMANRMNGKEDGVEGMMKWVKDFMARTIVELDADVRELIEERGKTEH